MNVSPKDHRQATIQSIHTADKPIFHLSKYVLPLGKVGKVAVGQRGWRESILWSFFLSLAYDFEAFCSPPIDTSWRRKKNNKILPAVRKPLTGVFSPLSCPYCLPLISGHISSPKSSFQYQVRLKCECVCECTNALATTSEGDRIHSSCYLCSHTIPCCLSWSDRLWPACRPPHDFNPALVRISVIVPLSITVSMLVYHQVSHSCCN